MKTVQMLLLQAYERYASVTAVSDEVGSLTYAEVADRAGRARSMLAGLQLGPGDRVGVVSANSVDYLIVDHACFSGGFVRVGINRRSSVAEVVGVARGAGLTVLFADAEWCAHLKQARPIGLRIVPLDAGEHGAALRDRLLDHEPAVESLKLRPEDPAALIFTSGTSGAPKAITVTQENLAATVRNILIELPIGHDTSALQPIPLSHAAMQFSLALLSRGARQHFLRTASPAETLDELAGGQHTLLTSVPTMLAMLAAEQLDVPRDLRALRAICYGGSSISAEHLRAAVAAFGPTLYQVYAQSESSLPLTCLDPSDHLRACADDPHLLPSAGRPGPFVELAIVTPDGIRLGPGESGEVVVRGESVTPGYWSDPEATAATIDAEGWLRTGDVGYLTEDGYLCIVDRIKDVVISGGFNVFPSEVENALHDLPGLQDVAVYGVPDEMWGERLCVAVVGDEKIDLETVQSAVRERLAGYKVPRELRRYEALPVNATGKVLRRLLREAHNG